jgi:CysZ protein
VNVLQQIQLGLASYKEAHVFIKQHKFYSFFFIPIVFNLILFLLFSGLVWHYAQLGADYVYYELNIDGANFGKLEILKSLLKFSIAFAFKILGLLLYVIAFRNIVLVLMAPVLTVVSERVAEIISGEVIEFSSVQFLKDVARGLVVALKNSVKEIFYTVIIFFLSFVPIIGFTGSLLLFAMQSYFYGFSMIDYTLEQKKLTVKQSENFIWNNKWLAITIGAIFNLLVILSTTFSVFPSIFVSFIIKVVLLIPLIALSVAPIYAVVAATLATLKIYTVEQSKL